MRSLRAALLCAWAASAAPGAVVSNVQGVVGGDGGFSLKATMPGGGSNLEWRWSLDTSFDRNPYRGSGSGTGVRFGVIAPGGVGSLTVNVLPVLDGDTGYDCATDSGFSTSWAEAANGATMSCVGPHIQVALPAASTFDPQTPSGLPAVSVPAITGTTFTATSCANIATQMAAVCGSGAHADDGQPDAVVIPWDLRCHVEAFDQQIACQNDDVKVVRSSRTGTPWCPQDGTPADPSYQNECTPHLRAPGENQSVVTLNAPTGTGGWIFQDLLIGTPTLESGLYSETAKVQSAADDAGDKLVTTEAAHGIGAPGSPSGAFTRVRIFDCAETGAGSLNGNRAYTVESATVLRITGAAGLDCTGGNAWVTRETAIWTTANPLFSDTANANTVGLRHVVVDQDGWYAHANWTTALRGNDTWVAESYFRFGNQVPHNGSSATYGRFRSASNMSGVGVQGDGVLRSRMHKVKFRGAGLAFRMGDSFVGDGEHHETKGLWGEVPDYWIDTTLTAGADGRTGADFVGRQALVEMKREEISVYSGFLAAGFPQLMGDNAVMNAIFLRSLPNGSQTGQNGSNNALIEHGVCYKMPACIAIEGHNSDVGTELGSAEGRYKIDNLLVAFSENRQTTAPSHTFKWGLALELIRTAVKTTAQHVTVYKPEGGRSPFYSHRSAGGGVRLDKWAVLGLNRITGVAAGPDLLYHVSEGNIQNPPSDRVSDADATPLTAADAFARAYRLTGTDSYWRNSLLVGGLEASGGAWDSTSVRVDAGEVSAELSGAQTGYSLTGITNATSNSPTTIEADIAACDVQADYSLGTPGGVCAGAAGDEGIRAAELRRGLMALEPHSSEAKPLAIAANGSGDGYRLRYGVPATADVVRVSWRGRDAVAVGADAGTGFAFADGGGSADTITRNDGGSWTADGYCVGCWIEVTDANTGANNKTLAIAAATATVLTVTATGGGDAGLATDSGDNTARFWPAWAWINDAAQTGARDRQITVSGLAAGEWHRLRVEGPMQTLYRTATP